MMSSKYVCRACAQAFRQGPVPYLKTIRLSNCFKPFSTLSSFNAKAETPTSPVTPPSDLTDPTPASSSLAASSEGLTSSTTLRIAQKLRNSAKGMTETYAAYGATELLFKECARQADYTIPQVLEKNGEIPKTAAGEDLGVGKGWWYEELGLPPVFANWAQVTFLHMWLLVVRLRCFPPSAASIWHQHLMDHFFYTAEDRMVTMHRITMRTLRNAYLKDFFEQYRGIWVAYDEGLMRGDAVMAAAVWRNIFRANENTRPKDLAVVVSYMRRMAKMLDSLDDEQIAAAALTFGNPAEDARNVEPESWWMKEPFAEENQSPAEAKAIR